MRHNIFLNFLILLYPASSFGAQIFLDFGSISSSTFGDTTFEIQYGSVATGINATLTSNNNGTFVSGTPANHGSITGTGADGDVRVNMTSTTGNTDISAIENVGRFTLTLWDSTIGDGYSTAYTSATDYEWDMVFYDIDAGDPNPNGFFTYDYVRLLTAGTYTITQNSNLVVDDTSNLGSVSFIGVNAGSVNGQDGLAAITTAPQRNASLVYSLENTNSIEFEYAALRNGGNNVGTGRNLLIDGGSLSEDIDGEGTASGIPTITGVVTGVPEPSSAVLIIVFGASSLLRRKR
ncbi:MAG: hypothetical protein ACSHX0_05935 [Akkermansiaceae bacterium]